MHYVSTYPPLSERSVLSPDSPELMDNSVGDCLSAMLQEDMLMGRDRPYGSRLNAAAHITVKNKTKHGRDDKLAIAWNPLWILPFAWASSSCLWWGGLYGAAPAANASDTNPSRNDREESTWKPTTTASLNFSFNRDEKIIWQKFNRTCKL